MIEVPAGVRPQKGGLAHKDNIDQHKRKADCSSRASHFQEEGEGGDQHHSKKNGPSQREYRADCRNKDGGREADAFSNPPARIVKDLAQKQGEASQAAQLRGHFMDRGQRLNQSAGDADRSNHAGKPE